MWPHNINSIVYKEKICIRALVKTEDKGHRALNSKMLFSKNFLMQERKKS
jgi:hypothetical protein